jgi:hypothetical protein
MKGMPANSASTFAQSLVRRLRPYQLSLAQTHFERFNATPTRVVVDRDGRWSC